MVESVLFSDFLVEDIPATGATIRTLRPVQVYLCSFFKAPDNLICHKIARHLADRFTVVLIDLRDLRQRRKRHTIRPLVITRNGSRTNSQLGIVWGGHAH